jgi:hypothetical protein
MTHTMRKFNQIIIKDPYLDCVSCLLWQGQQGMLLTGGTKLKLSNWKLTLQMSFTELQRAIKFYHPLADFNESLKKFLL